MRKHEILAAIVEMRFVNCKLCNKAVHSKMNDTNSLVHTKWNCKYHIVFAMVFSITRRCVNFTRASCYSI